MRHGGSSPCQCLPPHAPQQGDSVSVRPGNTSTWPLPRAGHHPRQYATCRLCGRQVSRGPGLLCCAGLWKHLKSMQRQRAGEERPRSSWAASGSEPPRCSSHELLRRATGPGSWAGGVPALWTSQREKELLRRERVVEWREQAGEEQAWRRVERAILEMRRKGEAEKEACQRERTARAVTPFICLSRGLGEIYSENTHFGPVKSSFSSALPYVKVAW